jgi:hypothetical protein
VLLTGGGDGQQPFDEAVAGVKRGAGAAEVAVEQPVCPVGCELVQPRY